MCDGGSVFDWNLARLLAEAARDEPEVIGRVVAGGGIGLFRKGVVDHLRPVCSLQADVLPDLAGRGLLRITAAGGEAGVGQASPFGSWPGIVSWPARCHGVGQIMCAWPAARVTASGPGHDAAPG